MPQTPLKRLKIIETYLTSVRPTTHEVQLPAVFTPSYNQLTHGVSYHTEEQIAISTSSSSSSSASSPSPSETDSDSTISGFAPPPIMPPGSTITPMLHQLETGRSIATKLQRGVSTVVLGDPLGAGKTLSAIIAYLACRQNRPDLGMVITVPDIVISDWLEALEKVGISRKKCFSITLPSDIAKLDLDHLPQVVLVKQSLTLKQSAPHHIYRETMKALYQSPRVHVFDEQTSPNPTMLALFECAKDNLRLILSGTVVTNSVQDVARQFNQSSQPGANFVKFWMGEVSNFFAHYFVDSFGGTSTLLPGMNFINVLNIASVLHQSVYSRFPSSLPIPLPPFEEHYHVLDPENPPFGQRRVRAEPRMLLGAGGASVGVDNDLNSLFFASHSMQYFPAKLRRLVTSSLASLEAGNAICDRLVVTASQTTTRHLVTALENNKDITRGYCIIPLQAKAKQRHELIAAARRANKSIIFVTESAKVEGFNIQKHLTNIVFFDAVRDAGDYSQAVGRAVRQGNLSERVHVEQYCTVAIADYIKTRIEVTRKAKTLLELIHADPAAIFLLLVAEEFSHPQRAVRGGLSVEATINSMEQSLKWCYQHLLAITQQTDSRSVTLDFIGLQNSSALETFDSTNWHKRYYMDPNGEAGFQHFKQIFLFADNLERFGFNETSAAYLHKVAALMQTCKEHFQAYICGEVELSELLLPEITQLAYSYDLVEIYLDQLRNKACQDSKLTDENAINLIRICYSVTAMMVSNLANVKNNILQCLQEQSFFTSLDLDNFASNPLLLTAFLDAAAEPAPVITHLAQLISTATIDDSEKINQLLSSLALHGTSISAAVSKGVQAEVSMYIIRLANVSPSRMYTSTTIDMVNERAGLLVPWLNTVLNYLATSNLYMVSKEELIKRCKKMLEKIPRQQANEINREYAGILGNASHRRTYAEANPVEETVQPPIKIRRIEEIGAGIGVVGNSSSHMNEAILAASSGQGGVASQSNVVTYSMLRPPPPPPPSPQRIVMPPTPQRHQFFQPPSPVAVAVDRVVQPITELHFSATDGLPSDGVFSDELYDLPLFSESDQFFENGAEEDLNGLFDFK